MNDKIVTLLLIAIMLTPACSSAKSKKAKERAIQEPVVAGTFYPDNPLMLKMVVDKFLTDAPAKELKGHVMGLVVPHAGYRFSGSVAGYAFKQLTGRQYKTVVVIAPSHRIPLKGAALSTKDFYRTPLGDIPIAKDVVEKLIKKYSWADDDQRPYVMEHSLEVELPFLQMVLQDFKIVPMIIGTHDQKTLDSIAQAVVNDLAGDDVLLVASTDLSHYKPYDEAVELDRRTLSYVKRGNPSKFWEAEKAGKVLACGAAPTYIVMKAWKLRGGGEVDVLQYLNSGDTAGDRSKVVGYAAVAFLTKGPSSQLGAGEEEFKLADEQKEKLLKLARETVIARVSGKKLPSIRTNDPLLKKNGAVFVTLKKNGKLRGCIGHIMAREPLIQNVRNMAVAAATKDARFPPVHPSELKDIHVEVSVLTPPQLLPNPQEIRVGTDGLILTQGFHRGVLLPQVPTEQGWNRDEYLRGICRKAGMEPTCWKTAKLERFQAIVFGE